MHLDTDPMKGDGGYIPDEGYNRNDNLMNRNYKHQSMHEKTRVIIKNIPKYMNEFDLKKHFFKMKGKYDFKITDIKIMKRKKIIKNKESYESRKICFIGFISNIDCENFKKSFNNTYIHTSKITIEDAFSPILSKNSNTFQLNGIQKSEKTNKKDKQNNTVKVIKNDQFINKMTTIKKTKAGMNTTRRAEKSEKKKKKKKKKTKKNNNASENSQAINGGEHNDVDNMEENTVEVEEENALDWLKGISKDKGNDKENSKESDGERNLLESDDTESEDEISSMDKAKPLYSEPEDIDYNDNINTGKLIIFNLPPVDEQDVKSLCERYGPVIDVHIFKNTKKGSKYICLNEKNDNKSREDFFIKLLKENNDNTSNRNKKNDTKKMANSNNTKEGNKNESENENNKNENNIANIDLTNVKTYAFVSFVFPSSCEKAKNNLNETIYRGKILSVKYAREKIDNSENLEKNKNNIFIKLSNESKTSYKKILEIQKKRNCQNENIWNILYTDINSNIYNFCKETNCDPQSILNIRDKNIAVNVSLTETFIINKMKEWIRKEGIVLEAFEQIYKKENAKPENDEKDETDKVIKYKRSDDTIIVKNLSMHTNENDIINLFKKHGILKKISFSPYKNIAILQYEKPEDAKKALISNSYIRYKKLPLYLEWAPVNLFEQNNKNTDETTEINENSNDALHQNNVEAYDSESSDEEITHSSIYIKNINFNTKEEDFKKLFEKLDGFITCNIVKSKKAIKQKHKDNTTDKENDKTEQENKYISLGYGFAEFKSKELAIEAIKKLTATKLDGHVLELSLSHNRIKKNKQGSKNNEEKQVIKDKKKITKKLLVKNLAFQVTKEELRKLFSAFGNIKNVRIPKNAYNRSRGYGFVEFMSKNECLAAINALQHTHLYGRHLIIDFANDLIFDQNVDEFDKMKESQNGANPNGKDFITSEQAKRKSIYENEKSTKISESKKRKIMGNLENV
ncbi:snoRNA-associated small subunit rRNA processing protein, putative [Plasmodium chabaudi chabaudi]|uniref:SnoRNA-associated small subunit rRNA processing protein, putative n=1 Tax=Plasmodium chabaudi chabaudi TaxID=31271 RepID=A0A1C6YSJ5_PLACU|nr:snoRNA-associated small subunit rRNA processing protein, putative [Plasmodium chabaudi chabaudi]